MPQREQNGEEEERLANMLRDRSTPPSVQKLHSKSIKAERVNFISYFDENLRRIQNKNKKPLTRVGKDRVTYERRPKKGHHHGRSQADLAYQFEDVFKLTKASFERDSSRKLKIVLTPSVEHLKATKVLLTSHIEQQFSDLERQTTCGRSLPLHETSFIELLPPKFTLTCIVVATLHSVKFHLLSKGG